MGVLLNYLDFKNRLVESAQFELSPSGSTVKRTIVFEKAPPSGKYGHNRVKVTSGNQSYLYKLTYNTPISSGDMNFASISQDSGINGSISFARYVSGGRKNEKMEYDKIKEHLLDFKEGKNVTISEWAGSLTFTKIK